MNELFSYLSIILVISLLQLFYLFSSFIDVFMLRIYLCAVFFHTFIQLIFS
jgi:hypothetical protein